MGNMRSITVIVGIVVLSASSTMLKFGHHHHSASIIKLEMMASTLMILQSQLVSVLAFQPIQVINQPTPRCSPSSSRTQYHHLFATNKGQHSKHTQAKKNTAKKRKTSKRKKKANQKVANKKRQTSKGAGVIKASSSTDDKKKKARIKSSSKQPLSSSKRQAKSVAKSNETNNPTSSAYYIQFSRVFQRHVVYMTNSNPTSTQAITDDDRVIQSFQFLDDAISMYPRARIIAPRDVPFPPPLCTIDWTLLSSSSVVVARNNKVEEECESTIAGMGLFGLCELEYDIDNNIDSHNLDGKCPVVPLLGGNEDDGNQQQQQYDEQSNEALRTLLQLVSSSSSSVVPRHFFRLDHRRFALGGHTRESIVINHARVASLLSRGYESDNIGLAMSSSDVQFVLSNFPQLCLYDSHELESLIRFLLAPLPPSTIASVTLVADTGVGGEKVDWPRLADEGYGVGLTLEQATKAIRMMPELMALYYEDSRKPSVGYMYTQLQQQMSPQLCDEVKMQLGQFLEGTDFSDSLTLGYLYGGLGISWKKLRILLSAFPLWTTNCLDPGWEILQRGPVRSSLKRHSLDYLRQRLQIRPGDVYKMIKTHTRLSTYDAATKILPSLDTLQSRLELRNSELRQLILRMPSVIGIGTSEKDGGQLSSFDQRLDFFQTEGTNDCVTTLDCSAYSTSHYIVPFTYLALMTKKEIKESVLKQPSLLQYGIASSLQPKLDFLTKELGIPREYISRIIHTSPAIMGLSLADTLRPKVASIMTLCALHPYEVGMVVTVSPPTLFFSQKGKIEPALKYLASALSLDEPRDLGEVLLKAPRLLRQGLETSLMKKVDLISTALQTKDREESKRVASEILRKNPALFDTSNAVITERIERCLSADKDVVKYLLPSKKGRNKLFQYPVREMGDPILVSNTASFDSSLLKIYPDSATAGKDMKLKRSDIEKACKNGMPLDEFHFSSLMHPHAVRPKPQYTPLARSAKTVFISMFCSGGTYPNDSIESTRGQSTTGGFAIQILSGGTDEIRLLFEMSNAANKCFGIRVPLGRERSQDKLLTVFPLMNPSRNRCDLFACSSALRVLEAFLATKRRDAQVFYDIKVHTDSTYAWKLVRDERLISLGSCFTSQEMLSKLDVTDGSSFNIDIFHPLARSFSRLNGQEEPPQSRNHRPFYNSRVQFCSSFDGELQPGDIKTLRELGKSAAMWQFNRERSFVPR